MIEPTANRPPEPARPARSQRLWGVFLAAWTVFTALAVWWLLKRAGTSNFDSTSFIEGGATANATLFQRAGNWLKLADLSLHQVYPWILLAPYVAWVGSRFVLERGRWRVGIPVHLAGCALFAGACHALLAYADWTRPVMITISSFAMEKTNGQLPPPPLPASTNFVIIVTNAQASRWSEDVRAAAGFRVGGRDGTTGYPALGGRGFFYRRRFAAGAIDVLNVFAYASMVGLVQTVRSRRQSAERERRAAALEAQLNEARLNTLQSQLHPHFLFNALNAISTLLRRDTRAAQDMLASFSELLRVALSYSTQPEVTLREDVEFLRRYVEIQQTRLGDRLRFEETIAPEALDYFVPALLLQPLVENAIRHGIEPFPNPGVVRVTAQLEGERLTLTVQDNGAGLSASEDARGAGAGIGLQNLAARLETLYGNAQKFQFGSQPDGGVRVTVEIPARRAPAAQASPTPP